MNWPWQLRLRARFILAGTLLAFAAVSSSLWTLAALSRLARTIDDTVEGSDLTTAGTAQFSGALEREDDALLLAIAQKEGAISALERERGQVDAALERLARLTAGAAEQRLLGDVRGELQAYRQSASSIIRTAHDREALLRYHGEANPLLRRVVESAGQIRHQHFEATRRVAQRAGAEVGRSLRLVLGIILGAVLVSALVAWHLSRVVIRPLRALAEGAEALRAGHFETRLTIHQRDEIGEVAETFNRMASDLGEFRRTNVAEVLKARSTLEATLEALPDAIILSGVDGRVLAANRSARALVGRSELASIHDVTFASLTGGELLSMAQSAGVQIDLSRAIALERDGMVRRLLPQVHRVPDHGTLLVLYDVTELARFDEMRAELVAVASHELRTPLTTMRMALMMLGESVGVLDTRQAELVLTLRGGIEQLQDTIDEFLDLTRIEAGKLRLNPERVRLPTLLSDTIDRWDARARAAGVRLSLELDAGVATRDVKADVRRLRMAFDNLIDNALRHTSEGGSIALAARSSALAPDALEISVTDTGPGVPEPLRARIFEKFFRVEHYRSNSQDGPRGAGLGLYLCREVVLAHAGSISCEAGEGERGARLVIRLPSYPNPREPLAGDAEPRSERPLDAPRGRASSDEPPLALQRR